MTDIYAEFTDAKVHGGGQGRQLNQAVMRFKKISLVKNTRGRVRREGSSRLLCLFKFEKAARLDRCGSLGDGPELASVGPGA